MALVPPGWEQPLTLVLYHILTENMQLLDRNVQAKHLYYLTVAALAWPAFINTARAWWVAKIESLADR